jgi:peroxiredoxin (alkyl hydroperoxide reductase subunit C)
MMNSVGNADHTTGLTPPPLLHDHAPDFVTRTTMGERQLSSYRGRWLVFFSHPADFTPVCTSEFIAFAKAYPQFQAAGCDLLALSVDSLFSHLAWARNIQQQFGIEIPFPIAEDAGLQIARAYGMVHPAANSSATVRATFVIDPLGVIRAITWYPMTTGRSIDELLRLVLALQASDEHDALTPENWHPGEPMLETVAATYAGANAMANQEGAADWYYHAKVYKANTPKVIKK